jgi:AraC-like DNA-binding protein
VFSFVDSSDSSRVKSDRGHHHRGVAPEGATRPATDRPVKDRKHPLYRCSGRTYLGNRLSPSSWLSIRKIASATGLSSSRIHQLLNAPEGKGIPVWLSQLRQSSRGSGGRKKAKRPESETEIRSRLAREVEVLRRCTDWLQRLERGENVVVNLRPDEDFETEFIAFDRPRVVRVLERIAADLDNLSLVPNDPHADKESNHHEPRARHRHELAEPPPKPKKLSHREQRTALRAALGLPPQ